MEVVLIVLGFLAFVAWRERQHALERAALSRRGGGRVPAPIAFLRPRRKATGVRVISADDDEAFLAKKARQKAEAGEEDEAEVED